MSKRTGSLPYFLILLLFMAGYMNTSTKNVSFGSGLKNLGEGERIVSGSPMGSIEKEDISEKSENFAQTISEYQIQDGKLTIDGHGSPVVLNLDILDPLDRKSIDTIEILDSPGTSITYESFVNELHLFKWVFASSNLPS